MSRRLLERYWEAQDPFDPEALGALRHPDWVADWPQTAERIPGHEQDVAIHANFPGYPDHELVAVTGEAEQWALTPMFVPLRISGEGPLWIAEAKLRYPDAGTWFAVAVMEVRDDLIGRETVYYCEPFEPPEWRARWVTPMGDGWTRSQISIEGGSDAHAVALEAVRRYVDAAGRGEPRETMPILYHEDLVEEIPQSGERIEGLSNAADIASKHPDRPSVALGRTWGTGNLVVAELELDYGGDPWLEVALMRFRDGKVAASTGYFAQRSASPAWREPWVVEL
jgi:hypothetical protein